MTTPETSEDGNREIAFLMMMRELAFNKSAKRSEYGTKHDTQQIKLNLTVLVESFRICLYAGR